MPTATIVLQLLFAFQLGHLPFTKLRTSQLSTVQRDQIYTQNLTNIKHPMKIRESRRTVVPRTCPNCFAHPSHLRSSRVYSPIHQSLQWSLAALVQVAIQASPQSLTSNRSLEKKQQIWSRKSTISYINFGKKILASFSQMFHASRKSFFIPSDRKQELPLWGATKYLQDESMSFSDPISAAPSGYLGLSGWSFWELSSNWHYGYTQITQITQITKMNSSQISNRVLLDASPLYTLSICEQSVLKTSEIFKFHVRLVQCTLRRYVKISSRFISRAAIQPFAPSVKLQQGVKLGIQLQHRFMTVAFYTVSS